MSAMSWLLGSFSERDHTLNCSCSGVLRSQRLTSERAALATSRITCSAMCKSQIWRHCA
jgi:hypothetical protein